MRPTGPLRLLLLAAFAVAFAASGAASPGQYFAIRVIDAATGRGVPLVELRAVNEASWWTDSNGLIAFDEPGLMDTEVFFQVSSPGYEYPEDMLHYRGVKLTTTRGARAEIKLTRTNLAERLYRITGQGIYRDSVLLGEDAPLARPTLNGSVMGQDTVLATPYRGKIFWCWGDTERPSYPLGHFGVAGATSEFPGHGGLDPGAGVDLTYFVDADGFSRQMCPNPPRGMRWLEGLCTVHDDQGRERLVGRLAVMKNLGEALEWHLMVFDDARQVFESVQRWDLHTPHGSAHPFRARVDGVDYYYLHPDYRVKADLRSFADLGAYEAFTCLAGQGEWHGVDSPVERDTAGRAHFGWKRGADRLDRGRLRDLVAAKKIPASESYLQLTDAETGKPLHCGLNCVAWNEYRQRWIGFLAPTPGEVWFAEADTPTGPWTYARRVVTHGDYNFYNVAHHPFFDQRGGALVYFEGTYTDSFSNAKSRTPRYNYNQLMYRLDLADDRLQLPVPVYRVRTAAGAARFMVREQIVAQRAWTNIEEIAFYALPGRCAVSGTIPVFAADGDDGVALSLAPSSPDARPLFVAWPASDRSSSVQVTDLRRYRRKADGQRCYSADLATPAEFEPDGPVLCRVWRSPASRPPMDWSAAPASRTE